MTLECHTPVARVPLAASRRDPVPRPRLTRLCLRLFAVGGGIVVLATTLFPYGPEWPVSLMELRSEAIRRVDWRVPSDGGLGDLLGNALLFAPPAFGLAGLLLARGVRSVQAVAGTTLLAALTSAAIEAAQLLLPSRSPAAGDLIANTLGGLAGAAAYCLAGAVLMGGLTRVATAPGTDALSARRLVIAFAVYAGLALAGSLFAARSSPLAGWDAGTPLTIYNEHVGHHPWRGVASDLLIADRAMDPAEADRAAGEVRGGKSPPPGVVAFYPLGGAADAVDRTGTLPPLQPRQKPAREQDGVMVSDACLTSPEAGHALARRLGQAGRFTLSVTLSAAGPVQGGHARIVSLSHDDWERNLTLAHHDAHLLVRVRTPLTGVDGARPQFLLPYLFADGLPHRVCVSFDGRRLRTYADGRPAGTVDLSPETTLVWRAVPFRASSIVLGRTDACLWRLGYDAAVFAPLGLLAGLLACAMRGAAGARVFIAVAGVVVAPVTMQLDLALLCGWPTDWASAASGAAVAAAAAVVGAAACAGR